MVNPIPVIPTLKKGTVDRFTKMQAVVWSLIEFFFHNPGEISDRDEGNVLSFRKLESLNGTATDTLASAIRVALEGAIQRYYPDAGLTVEVGSNPIDENKYTVEVVVLGPDNLPFLPIQPITVTPSHVMLTLDEIAE